MLEDRLQRSGLTVVWDQCEEEGKKVRGARCSRGGRLESTRLAPVPLLRIDGCHRSLRWPVSSPALRTVVGFAGRLLACAALIIDLPRAARADNAERMRRRQRMLTKQEKSPWLLTPLVQSNPKLGTSFGALGGYLHNFDAEVAALHIRVARPVLEHRLDHRRERSPGHHSMRTGQRLIAGLMYGYIKNDYDDYLGTGVPLKSNAELRSFITRYLYRVKGNWFVGAQGIYQNFAIGGETAFDDQVLDILGVRPYKSGGLGLVAYYDSRDNENMPTRGWVLSLSNIAYRESLGGEENFDVYRADIRYFLPHGKGNVFAIRQLNHLTHDAPTQVRATVQLRGYKVGQYNGEYMSSIEFEERWRHRREMDRHVFRGSRLYLRR